jgi:VWFA-related protein
MRTRSSSYLACLTALILAAGITSLAQGPVPAVDVPTIAASDAARHRLWVLLFDLSSMQPPDVARAKAAAIRWIDASVLNDDLVSVVTVATTVKTPQNFTADVDRLRAAIAHVAAVDSSAASPELQERDYFNNDLRFRGIRTLCGGLQSIEQKKAIMLFTALREHPGPDNQVEVRAASEACNRANASVNPIDVRRVGTSAPGGLDQ